MESRADDESKISEAEEDEIAKNVEVQEFNSNTEKMYYKRSGRHYLADEPRKERKDTSLTAAAYNKLTKILVLGKSTDFIQRVNV